MFKIIFWSTPVLFGCIVPLEDVSGMVAHIKLTNSTVEYVSEPTETYENAEKLYEQLIRPLPVVTNLDSEETS